MENGIKTIAEAVIETNTTEVASEKSRNYSFRHREDSTLDAIEKDDQIYVIPAQPGSTYWAILKILYEHADQPLSVNQIIDEVAELLEDREPEKWERYKNKESITTRKDGQQVRKQASNWRSRLETNIKTLTRSGGSNQYGLRLIERGHILRWEPDHFKGNGAYVLRTTTNQPLPSTKSKKTKANN